MIVEGEGLRVDLSRAGWRKSSASGPFGDNCVQVAGQPDGGVAIRDSKDPAGPVLLFTRGEWEAFLVGMQAGEFDDV